MEKSEKIKYKKQIQLYKKFGAEHFQKIVFGVEKVKFKLLKTICPNFIKYFDKYADFKQKRILKNIKSPNTSAEVIEKFKFSKMAMRREFYQEKNINYHINNNNPTEIYEYLQWNKDVHKHAMIKNLIAIPIYITGIALGFTVPATILLSCELIGLGINFECINIQNYNICRYKLSEETLKKKRERRQKENIEKYGEAAELIRSNVEKQEQLPSMAEIINNATSKEQLSQLRELLLRELKERNINYNRGNK